MVGERSLARRGADAAECRVRQIERRLDVVRPIGDQVSSPSVKKAPTPGKRSVSTGVPQLAASKSLPDGV
jgi:hypothetical protein